MALSSECMPSCAQKELDRSDIVIQEIFRQRRRFCLLRRERFANHRLVTGTRNIVEGSDSGEVTNLPLVGQPIGQLAHFRLGQVHQQLREV
jgi:hypothetical protein